MPKKKIEKKKMVGWYNPIQLIKTGYQFIISDIFGRHSDRRLLDAALHSEKDSTFFDFSETKEEEFWIDYIADVGDGWNSTYAMAYYLGKPELKFNQALQLDENGNTETKRGNILIFGGDEVYPTATHSAYKHRLVVPYQKAFSESISEDSPTVFAIPGNHDWYDSLVSFSKRFLWKIKNFAGWMTLQKRSYFAIKLPNGWWLFGTDMQLGSALDAPQQDFFENVMNEHVQPSDCVILCNAEPYWILQKVSGSDTVKTNRAMGFFEGNILKRRATLFLAGDLHHYRRHENPKNGKQKITAGGGGAFLHPTHGADVSEIGSRSKYQLKKSFPDEKTSWRLTFWNLLFPAINPAFGLATGILYLLTAKAFLSDLGGFGIGDFCEAFYKVLNDLFVQPLALFWSILILGGFILFTDTHSRWFRWAASLLHGIAHLAAVFFISWGVARLFNVYGYGSDSVWELFAKGVAIFALGWLVGSLIMGIYLFISLNLFKKHSNEAFSSLAIEDYKNFIRIKINNDGNLEVFPIGIKRVPRKWKETGATDGSAKIEPDDVKASDPALIEKSFVVKKLPPNKRNAPKTSDKVDILKESRTKKVSKQS